MGVQSDLAKRGDGFEIPPDQKIWISVLSRFGGDKKGKRIAKLFKKRECFEKAFKSIVDREDYPSIWNGLVLLESRDELREGDDPVVVIFEINKLFAKLLERSVCGRVSWIVESMVDQDMGISPKEENPKK